MASEPASTGIPTARSVEHIGITVPDLDEAEEFFVDILGCEKVFEGTPPIDESVKDWMERNLGVHRESKMRFMKLRCGPSTNVELLEYDDPTQREEHPTNSDPGATHLCFYVEDMEAAVEYLEEVPGVELQGEPRTAEGGPLDGLTFLYFRTPWGLQLEILHAPDDVGYKRAGHTNDLDPAPSWDYEPEWDQS